METCWQRGKTNKDIAVQLKVSETEFCPTVVRPESKMDAARCHIVLITDIADLVQQCYSYRNKNYSMFSFIQMAQRQ